jgi:ligand-binding sensor domain-containing protein
MLRVTHLNVENGLSQSSVYSIMQDSYGFIWMATGDGLNRYDGKTFIAYKSKLNSTLNGQLKDRNINSTLHEDANHNIWFAADEGVYCLERRTGRFSVKLNKFHTGYAATLAAAEKTRYGSTFRRKGCTAFLQMARNPNCTRQWKNHQTLTTLYW